MDSNNSEYSSASGIKVVTRKYLYEKMKDQNLPTFSEKLDHLKNYLVECYGLNEENKKSLKNNFSKFKSQMKDRWLKAQRTEEIFLKNNQPWLEGTFEIPLEIPNRQGRPCKSFEDSSERSKRRKTEEIRATVDNDVIVHAAQVILQTDGQRNASKILRERTNCPEQSTKLRKSNENETIAPLTPFEALKMFVEADLTRRQYEIIRATNPRHFPCYDLLLKDNVASHPMTPTMHKILLHGARIIENALLPMGQLSEEAAEAQTKHFRSYRLNYARKFSREECNLDIYHRLLLTSDPLLSSIRTYKKNPHKPFSSEAIQLLLPGSS